MTIDGDLYYSLSDGNSSGATTGDAIVRINPDGSQTTVASDFTNLIQVMALDTSANTMFVLDNTGGFSDSATGNTIWSVNLTTGAATKIFTGVSTFNSGTTVPMGTALAYDSSNNEVYFTEAGKLMKMTTTGGSVTAVTSSAVTASASSLVVDGANNRAFLVDTTTADREIFSINLTTGAVTKIFQNTSFILDGAVAYNPADGDLYFSENASGSSAPNLYKISANPGSILSSGTLVASAISPSNASTLTLDSANGIGYVRSFASPTFAINQVNLSTGAVSTITSSTGAYGLSVVSPPDVVCFCSGTLIATPDGDVPVETLQPGGMVLTQHNGPREIKWIGKGSVLATRGKRNVSAPVIVRKGALADNVPNQNLYLTKAHSLYIDGVLIPVEFLINHRTILWDDRVGEIDIYHVELESHDVLLANGAPAETYRDDGNRWLFRNANDGWHLPPREPCAPVLTGGPVVDAIWRRLLDRAGPRNLPPLTDDPDLHLIVDGIRVDPLYRHKSRYGFRLPNRPESVIIGSRTGVPSELGIARDPRPLGVALRQVLIRQGARFMLLDADDERLTQGFHDYEPLERLRWTNGHAALPARDFSKFDQGAEVIVRVGGATRYRDDHAPARHRAA